MKQNVFIIIQKITDQWAHLYQTEQEQQQIAWWLLQAITGQSKAQLIAQSTIALTEQQQKKLDTWIQEHTTDLKPLQYILGSVPFCGLDILVESPVLIPRPETEEWCSWLIKKIERLPLQKIAILDLCTGSGCIALAFAHALPQATVIGTDIDEKALKLAQKNATHNNITNVTFVYSDLYHALEPQPFDLIVANPPYIAPQEWQTLSPMVKKWEDRAALVANREGFAVIFAIIEDAKKFLAFNQPFYEHHIPQLAIEIDYDQGASVLRFMQEQLFVNPRIWQDLEGKDRLALANI